MDPIRDSFSKVKQDIDTLGGELEFLREALTETRNQMTEVCDVLTKLFEKTNKIQQDQQNIFLELSTHKTQIQTLSTHSSTHNPPFKPLNDQILPISTGNGGVPTDRQTHQQTDNSTHNTHKIQENSVDNAAEILASLDSIRKEIRLKFKRLTDQEWLIFSTLYQIDETEGPTDYKTLADKLKLTESSIRDYIGRLIKKGIPVEKNKINNKTIQLSISSNLKKIASLPTIIQLRGI